MGYQVCYQQHLCLAPCQAWCCGFICTAADGAAVLWHATKSVKLIVLAHTLFATTRQYQPAVLTAIRRIKEP